MKREKPLGRRVVVKTQAEFTAAIAAAPGSVVVEFTMKGCGACTDEAPGVKALARDTPVTVVQVDADVLPALADKFDVQALPAFFAAPSGKQMTPEGAKGLDDVRAVRKYLR